tara:strand:- start:1730 stop:2065 length:336 start_codon:yes stop_codon:yes gene_type:complete
MTRKRPYYPNNWREIKDAPSEYFQDMPFEQLMDWKIGGWQLPSSINCIIRETCLETGKTKEHIYQRGHAAKAKVNQLMNEGLSEFVVCSHDSIHHLFPKEYFNDKDYDYEI